MSDSQILLVWSGIVYLLSILALYNHLSRGFQYTTDYTQPYNFIFIVANALVLTALIFHLFDI